MNEKQILKEIAYYSKLINNHKKCIEKNTKVDNSTIYRKRNFYVTQNAYDLNKYKYVKPEPTVINVKQKILSLPQEKLPEKPNKVLINPNFKQSVHINPNFQKVQQTASSKVHINPKIINVNFIKKQQTEIKPTPTFIPPTKVLKPTLPIDQSKISPRKRRVSIRTKYKIVKSNNTPKISPNKTINNRFKIDRTKPVSVKKRVVFQSINDSIRTCLFKNKVWKKSPLKLVRNNVNCVRKVKVESVKNKRSLITLRGKKYTTGLNKKSLKIVQSNKNNLSTKKTTVKSIVRSNSSVRSRKLILSQRKIGSFTNLRTSILRKNNLNKTERASFRKNNIPCPVYCRFGKCRRKDAGRCIFKHNPDQIALCKNFLQGACLDDNCLLSHKVSLEKMPTCKYFLEGCCVRPSCSYLHVKISPNADICKNFLEGFCKEGMKCNKRHQYLCPDYEKYAKCERLRCRYPHINKCVKENVTKKVKNVEKIFKPKEKLEKIENPVEVPRYYSGNKETSSNLVSDSDKLENDDNENYKRIKLGILPSFIPID